MTTNPQKQKTKNGNPRSLEILKFALPLLITVIISVVGWFFTDTYNDAQIKIADQKNQADIEIAQINAALQYVDLTKNRADLHPDDINQAQTIIAPVLAPELAFDLALKNIFSNPTLINVLINQYGEEVPSLVAPLYLQFPYDLIADKDRPITSNSEYATYLENKKIENNSLLELLEVLDQRGLLDKFFDHLISDSFKHPYSRNHSLYYYYQYLNKKSIKSRHKQSEFLKRKQEVAFILQRTDIPDLVKSEIFTAIAFIYTLGYDDSTEAPLLEIVAKYFWEGFNVSLGEYPSEKTLKGLLYENKFYLKGSEYFQIDPADIASKSLWKKLDQLDFSTFDFAKKELILYQYASTTRVSTYDFQGKITGHFSYLMPKKILALVQKIITSMNSYEEKKNMAFTLSYYPGIEIYHKIFKYNTEIAKEYIEILLNWYEQNDSYDWHIPSYLKYEVVDEFPSFKDRINALSD